ncbi:MAG TPA: hypothetical protein ENG63_08305 [Candidatus Desulfofervidus auxilii]|uniref:Uncharacterized protein n=1 Tax=Desulfofervidus auxilii TaxID=1621989 RepID=A0A7C0U3M5_DESA2|nr:hypothetical protein [Candidatus Desulfofervidus auxilii]
MADIEFKKYFLTRYLRLSGVSIYILLKNRTVQVRNAIIKDDKIINNYYEDFQGEEIPLEKINKIKITCKEENDG